MLPCSQKDSTLPGLYQLSDQKIYTIIPMERKKIDEANHHIAIGIFFKGLIINVSPRIPMSFRSNKLKPCGQVFGIVLSFSLSFACRLFLQDLNLPPFDRRPAATCPGKEHMLIVQLIRQIPITFEVCFCK